MDAIRIGFEPATDTECRSDFWQPNAPCAIGVNREDAAGRTGPHVLVLDFEPNTIATTEATMAVFEISLVFCHPQIPYHFQRFRSILGARQNTVLHMPRERGDNTKFGLPPDPEPWKPFPQDPPWDTPLIELNGFWLKTECALHGTVAYPLRLMAAEQGWDTTLRTVIPKLRCRTCRAKPVSVILANDSYSKRVEHRMG